MIQNYSVIHTIRLHPSNTSDIHCNIHVCRCVVVTVVVSRTIRHIIHNSLNSKKLKLTVKVTVSCGLWTVDSWPRVTGRPPARYLAYCSFPGNDRIQYNVTIWSYLRRNWARVGLDPRPTASTVASRRTLRRSPLSSRTCSSPSTIVDSRLRPRSVRVGAPGEPV